MNECIVSSEVRDMMSINLSIPIFVLLYIWYYKECTEKGKEKECLRNPIALCAGLIFLLV